MSSSGRRRRTTNMEGDNDDIETIAPPSKRRRIIRSRKPGSGSSTIVIPERTSKSAEQSDVKAHRKGSSTNAQNGNQDVDGPEITRSEKRLRRYRAHAPQSYLDRAERALTQRMFVLSRTRNKVPLFDLEDGDVFCPTETIEMAGTTGNIYTITIDKVPSCTCPDNLKGNQCKHIIYVLVNVLRAPDHLQYQLAFLTDELKRIFENAPVPLERANKQKGRGEDANGKRKSVEGDCPICFTPFEPDKEDILWCKASCGNNLHRQCFETWAATAAQTGNPVRCVYCRSPWQSDDISLEKIRKSGNSNLKGYVNVGVHFGLSGVRDYSTYHPFWVRQQQWDGDF